MTGPTPEPRSLARVQIGNRIYDARRVTSCPTCCHPARMQIEVLVAEGKPYPYIADQYSDVEYIVGDDVKMLPAISWMSIRSHYLNGHMPTEMKAVRDIAEARIRELGRQHEELTEEFVDSYVTARVIMSMGLKRIISGEIVPTVRETLAAAKLLEEFKFNEQQGSESVTAEAWQEAMQVYFTQARQLMPDEMWDMFMRRLTTNPQLRALEERLQKAEHDETGAGGDYVEAQIVEEEAHER